VTLLLRCFDQSSGDSSTDVRVSRQRQRRSRSRVHVQGVFTPFAHEHRSVAEHFLKYLAMTAPVLHTPLRQGTRHPLAAQVKSTSRNADKTLRLALSRVFPWPHTPSSCGMVALQDPPSSTKRIVKGRKSTCGPTSCLAAMRCLPLSFQCRADEPRRQRQTSFRGSLFERPFLFVGDAHQNRSILLGLLHRHYGSIYIGSSAASTSAGASTSTGAT
jgi:hypothetical protein